MKKILILLCSVFVLSGLGRIEAQDIHFSQFYMSPLNLNPALTGVMNCKIRMVANYRNQWASILRSNAFNTIGASYDQKFATGRNDYFGIGGRLFTDVVGQSVFATTSAGLSGSYSRKMGGDRIRSHYLVLGAEAAIAQRSLNFASLQFGTQHDGAGGFDPTADSGENFGRDQFLFADLNVGLLWFSILDRSNSWYAGVAYSHINRPNMSFADFATIPLFTKVTAHAGGDFELTDDIGILPGVVMFSQGPHFQLNFGTSLRFDFNTNRFEEQSFQFGVWTRIGNRPDNSILNDALILSTRFDYNQFGIGFSYDINTSSLRNATNGNGSFEFSLIYNICGPEDRGTYCPRF